ncbi:MAG: DEAD/DEAH box helicase, partial [Nanoarchaeota archaeon]
MSTFEQLGVKPELVRALHDLHIIEPTLIQEKAIPFALSGTDIIGISKTGSGKTAAFGIPLLCNLIPGKGVQVLIVAPTRELAVQISNELQKFGKYIHCSIATVYGGMSFN